MSAPFRLPSLLGKKYVVASAVRDILQFECNKLLVKKHIGRAVFFLFLRAVLLLFGRRNYTASATEDILRRTLNDNN